MKFTSLLHHITEELLRSSFFELKKQAAPGIDGETWGDYAKDYKRRISDLHGRIHRGAYRAKPSKRSHIPKTDGTMRETLGLCLDSAEKLYECFDQAPQAAILYDTLPEKPCSPTITGAHVALRGEPGLRCAYAAALSLQDFELVAYQSTCQAAP